MSQVAKNIILYSITIFIAIMTLVSLAFPLIICEAEIYGVSAGLISESGFDFLGFSSAIISDGWLISLVGTLCIVQLIVAILIVLVNAISIFILDQDNALNATMISIIICFVLNLLYLIAGCVAVANFNGSTYSYRTVTFVPFILNLVFTFAYIGFVFYTKKIPQKNSNIKKDNVVGKDFSNVDLLIKYKQLLDDGIISQEEFEQKKSKLL